MASAPFFAIPAADPALASQTFERWRRMGYKTAALVDGNTAAPRHCDRVIRTAGYYGWPWAANRLCELLPGEAVCLGGADMHPDPKLRAEVILKQFLEHFPDTMGVMQPTGDRWLLHKDGTAASDRICGSPWVGRKFIETWNGGRGPLWPEYFHNYADEELHDTTQAAGVLWQRRDLTQYHDHWERKKLKIPYYLQKTHDCWDADKAVFDGRKAQGFPGSRPDNGTRPRLSILICHMPRRDALLNELMAVINRQADAGCFEVLVETDDGQMPIGRKRNKLLWRARGDFVVFCDDDDLVDPAYISKILAATASNPDVVNMVGLIYEKPGETGRRFIHSLDYKTWFETGEGASKVYFRNPNHLNPVKRSLALLAGFPEKNHGEDHEYSKRLLPLLKTATGIPDPIYHYYAGGARR